MDSSELTRLYDFTGQTVVITGGTGTLGGEIACALVGCGANVAILDRNLDPAQRVLELMEPRTNHAVAVRADVLDPESLRQGAAIILEKFGAVHGLATAPMRARLRRKRRQKPCKPAFPRPGLTQRIRPLSRSRTSV